MSTVLGSKYVTTQEAAEILGVSAGRVRQFVVEDRLVPVDRIGPALVFLRKDVEDFAALDRPAGGTKRAS